MNNFELNDEKKPMPIMVVVLDRGGCRLGTAVEFDAALTLWATMSEDPSTWDEVAGYWARYRCPAVCEFVDGLPIRFCDRKEAMSAIEGHGNWLAIDLIQKRIVTGLNVQPLGREATLALVTDEKGKQHCPLPFRLPPWWELHEAASTTAVYIEREGPLEIPRTDRPFLFGSPMIEDFAKRILQVAIEGRLPGEQLDECESANALHALTVEVHRDWLMTPRAELGGRRPRDLLHGAHDWSDAIIWGQQQRFGDGAPMTAAPDDVLGYADAPMGREEMIIYFDLCREVIASGWFWCKNEIEANGKLGMDGSGDRSVRLSAFLSSVRDSWLAAPFEGGSPPDFIIECSRRRVPRGSQVPIIGMDGEESEQHMPDCDCPICDMMTSGLFGVGFTSLDGHQLDLDDEFAFSTHETKEAWEEQQREFAEMSASIEREAAARQAKIDAGELDPDEFASVWTSPGSEQQLPGDPLGHLMLSFRLAEIIGDLESASAPKEIIKNLNVSFREYRESNDADLATAKATMRTRLDAAAEQFPDLLPKVADFQSKVDEQERASLATGIDRYSDDDFPF